MLSKYKNVIVLCAYLDRRINKPLILFIISHIVATEKKHTVFEAKLYKNKNII